MSSGDSDSSPSESDSSSSDSDASATERADASGPNGSDRSESGGASIGPSLGVEGRSTLALIADRIPGIVAGLAVIAIVIIICLVIITRNVGHRILGLNAMAQILGVWVVFILAGGLALERRHIQIRFFTDRLPDPLDRYHEIAVTAFVAVVTIGFLISALAAAWASLGGRIAGPGIPLLAYFIAPVIGMGLLAIVSAHQLFDLLGIRDRIAEVRASD